MNKTYKKLLIGLFTGLMAVTVYAVAVELGSTSLFSDADLTAYYKLEDANDNQDVGTDYNLTNTGAVPFNAAKFNNGADFTPNDSLNNNSVLGVTTYPRTFTGWVKFDSVTASDRTVFSLSDGVTHYYILKVRSSDSHLVFRSNNATQAADVDSGQTMTTGTWYCYAIIQNSATSMDFYIDAVAKAVATTTYSATVSQYYMGYLGRSSVWYLDGIIDDVALFKRALTSAEISGICNGFPPAVTSPSTLGFFMYFNKRR